MGQYPPVRKRVPSYPGADGSVSRHPPDTAATLSRSSSQVRICTWSAVVRERGVVVCQASVVRAGSDESPPGGRRADRQEHDSPWVAHDLPCDYRVKPNMIDHGTRFVVFTTQRTGSTWLMSVLNNQDGVSAQGELF